MAVQREQDLLFENLKEDFFKSEQGEKQDKLRIEKWVREQKAPFEAKLDKLRAQCAWLEGKCAGLDTESQVMAAERKHDFEAYRQKLVRDFEKKVLDL